MLRRIRFESTRGIAMLDLNPSSFAQAATVIAENSDYAHVKRAIEFMSGAWRRQPSLDEIAERSGP
jgi:hypothetical protein